MEIKQYRLKNMDQRRKQKGNYKIIGYKRKPKKHQHLRDTTIMLRGKLVFINAKCSHEKVISNQHLT